MLVLCRMDNFQELVTQAMAKDQTEEHHKVTDIPRYKDNKLETKDQ